MGNTNRDQLEQNNIRRLASLIRTMLIVHLGLLVVVDVYNYFNDVWAEFTSQYYVFLIHVCSLPVLGFLYWLNNQYVSQTKKRISHNALVVLNILILLPFLLTYYYWDIKDYGSTGIFLIYLFAVGYTLRVNGIGSLLLCLHFLVIYFGMLLYHGLSYLDNPSIYLNGIAAIVVYYFTSLKIFEVEIESINNKSVVVSRNDKLKNLNSELSTSNEQLNVELKSKLLQLLQGNTIMDKLMDTVINKDNDEVELALLKKLLREYNSTYHAEHIENRFLDAHNKFVKELTVLHPDLSLNNIKLCILIKLGISAQEIAEIRSVSPRSVHVAKTRLRKQLNIDEGMNDLSTYFNNIEIRTYEEINN